MTYDITPASGSAHTRRAYRQGWEDFCAWASHAGAGAEPLPAASDLVVAYLEMLHADGLSLATIRQRKAAIAAVHKGAGQDDPTGAPVVAATMMRLAKASRGQRPQQAALTATVLARIRATACLPRAGRGGATEDRWTAKMRGKVDIALATVMRDAMLRRSEAAAITWADVDLDHRPDGTGRLTVRRSKAGDEGEEGDVLYLGAAAVEALKDIRPDHPPPDAPVFGVSESQIHRRLRAAGQAAGIEGLGGNSPRLGMTVDLAAAGADPRAVMTAGRWRSPRMPAAYASNPGDGHDAVARYYETMSGG